MNMQEIILKTAHAFPQISSVTATTYCHPLTLCRRQYNLSLPLLPACQLLMIAAREDGSPHVQQGYQKISIDIIKIPVDSGISTHFE